MLQSGRRLALCLDPGDEVLASIADACRRHGITQGIILTFSGALRSARLIAATTAAADPEVPLPEEVTVRYTEGIGSGTITSRDGITTPHIHVALGSKDEGGLGYAGHLLEGEAHYVVEIVIEEVLSPRLESTPRAGTYGIPTLGFAAH